MRYFLGLVPQFLGAVLAGNLPKLTSLWLPERALFPANDSGATYGAAYEFHCAAIVGAGAAGGGDRPNFNTGADYEGTLERVSARGPGAAREAPRRLRAHGCDRSRSCSWHLQSREMDTVWISMELAGVRARRVHLSRAAHPPRTLPPPHGRAHSLSPPRRGTLHLHRRRAHHQRRRGYFRLQREASAAGASATRSCGNGITHRNRPPLLPPFCFFSTVATRRRLLQATRRRLRPLNFRRPLQPLRPLLLHLLRYRKRDILRSPRSALLRIRLHG
ncbi:hypothetical protein DFH09DRAFT_1372879, partial [Mycena vulgaris]